MYYVSKFSDFFDPPPSPPVGQAGFALGKPMLHAALDGERRRVWPEPYAEFTQ